MTCKSFAVYSSGGDEGGGGGNGGGVVSVGSTLDLQSLPYLELQLDEAATETKKQERQRRVMNGLSVSHSRIRMHACMRARARRGQQTRPRRSSSPPNAGRSTRVRRVGAVGRLTGIGRRKVQAGQRAGAGESEKKNLGREMGPGGGASPLGSFLPRRALLLIN